jgi:hypothetical protein
MARRKRVRKNEPKPAKRQDHTGPGMPEEADDLLEAAEANWQHVLMMYKVFEAKKPVMLYENSNLVVNSVSPSNKAVDFRLILRSQE